MVTLLRTPLRTLVRVAFLCVFGGAACTQILGIEEGLPIDEEECSPEDDENPCTVDACVDGQPTHAAGAAQVACYTGPEGTDGVGACKAGIQQCSAEGETMGVCEGEVLPGTECVGDPPAIPIDEDCDGAANEDSSSCVCGDQVTSEGEECDDGNADDTDDCAQCALAACGDGFLKVGVEECDDGGAAGPLDGCDANCDHEPVLGVSAGSSHSCARLAGGSVKCWGYNVLGTLGLGDTSPRGVAAGQMGAALFSVDLGAGLTAAALATYGSHTCALLNGGSAKCWGDNGAGRLGLGDTNSRGDSPMEMGDSLPTVVVSSTKAPMAITAGGSHTCALLSGGSVKCWGANLEGQLGLGNTSSRGESPGEMGDFLPAVALDGLATAVTAGDKHTCAILVSGSVKCWGDNAYGQLGLGDTEIRGDESSEMGTALPSVDLGTGKTAMAVTAGFSHTCALLNDGSVKCWGFNIDGQLGLGDAVARGNGPLEMGDALPVVSLGSGKTATAIAAGGTHTCALLNDGSIKCWGFNFFGQLGLGDMLDRGDQGGEMGDSLPNVGLGTSDVAVAIAAGNSHSCALLDDGSVKCWGLNTYGQLGLGDTAARGDAPGEMGDALPQVLLYSDTW